MNFDPQSPDLNRTAPSLADLEKAFQVLTTIENPLAQDYELILQAKQFNLDVDSYRRLFDTYGQVQSAADRSEDPLKPLKLADRTLGDFVRQFENLSLLQLANLIGQLTLLLALVSYVVEAPKRHQEAINNARDILDERSDQPFSEARQEAFEFLNRNCIPIVGFSAEKADLPGIQMNQCYRWQWNRQSLLQFPPQLRRYEGADLSNLNLKGANFQGADLTGANFTNSDLSAANLSDAILTGANFQGANLAGANFNETYLDGARFDDSNLTHAQMNRSSLVDARFVHANLTDVDLIWSNLSYALFSHAQLPGANLSRANLKNADFYRANLEKARFRHADLGEHTNLREAIVTQGDFRSARLSSVDQVNRAIGWDAALKDSDWQAAMDRPPAIPKIGLVLSSTSSIFYSYRQGMDAVEEVEIVTGLVRRSQEAEAIESLIDSGAEAIVLRPNDPEDSVPVLKAAYEQGIAIVMIGECINRTDAERYGFGCYESNSFDMGYESTSFMVETLEKTHPNTVLKIAVIDGTSSGRLYPYFQGFRQALRDAGQPWQEVGSSSAHTTSDKGEIIQLIRDHPEIHAVWSASNGTTEAAVTAVQQLNLADKIQVFGILDLTPAKAQMLLDPTNPLHTIVDQHPREAGELAAKRALEVLKGENLTYQYGLIPHLIWEQDDHAELESFMKQTIVPTDTLQ